MSLSNSCLFNDLIVIVNILIMDISCQILWLFVLPIPISCIVWTVTNEEIFREPRTYCAEKSRDCSNGFKRKFFYLFTCEYCFSHYVTLLVVCLTNFKLLTDNWTGYLISTFSLVWIANIYMSLFALLRQEIKKDKSEIDVINWLKEK